MNNMLPGKFYRKLIECNRNIRIYPNIDLNKPSGLYLVDKGELRHVCGVDNRNIPERHYTDYIGHVIKRGWRVTVQILINRKIIRLKDAERIFNTKFNIHLPTIKIGEKPRNLREEISKESKETRDRMGGKEGNLVLKKDVMVDFSKEIIKENTDLKKSDLKESYNAQRRKGFSRTETVKEISNEKEQKIFTGIG